VSNSETHLSASLDPKIAGRLRALDRRLRLLLALRGMGWTALALAAAGLVSFAVDYGLYRFLLRSATVLQRVLIDALCVAGVAAWVVRKRWFHAVLRRFTEEDAALLAERGCPQLEDRLISAWQFVHRAVPADSSAALVRKVIEEANALAAGLRFDALLRSRPARRALAGAAVAALCLCAAACLRPDVASAWAVRNLLLRDVPYPKETILDVQGGNPMRVVRGESLQVTVRVRKGTSAPEAVLFRMRFPSAGLLTESVSFTPEDRRAYVKTFPTVTEPFVFNVMGNDDRTEDIAVELVEPPGMEVLVFEVQAPAYTGLRPATVHPSRGVFDVPEGSLVAFRGTATKDLAEAAVLLDEQPVGECHIEMEPPEAGSRAGGPGRNPPAGGTPAGRPRRLKGEFPVRAPVPFRPRLNLRFTLRDTDGFVNPKAAAYSVNLAQDQPPAVHLEALGMGGAVSRQAAVPLTINSRDDYGVAELFVTWSVQSSPGNVQRLRLRPYVPAQPQPEPVQWTFDLRELAGRGDTNMPPLDLGENLRLQASVLDSLPAAVGGPHETLSNLITFRIASDDDIIGAVLDSQRAVREQIYRVAGMQRGVRDVCARAAGEAVVATTLGLARRETGDCADVQQQIRDLLQGAVAHLSELIERLRNNRVVAGENEVTMRESVIAPLRRVTDGPVTDLARDFLTLKDLSDGPRLAAELTARVAVQDRVLEVLEGVMREMIKAETAQEVEKTLRSIIRASDKVRDILRPAQKAGEKKRSMEP
jgi:hypothetical protein